MAVVELKQNQLVGGFYTLREAARLLLVEGVARLRGWLTGYSQSNAGPIIKRQYEPISNIHEVGFLDLMEMRFVKHFRQQGLSLQSLRKAAENARSELQQTHPFASSNLKFLTDRKEVFLHTAEEEGDRFLLNLMTNQIEIYEVLEQVLAKGVTFHPITGVASQWHPMPGNPNVIVNPLISYGQPVVAPRYVPTKAILSLWKAENRDYRAVADWFEINRANAEEAVEFELSLAA